MITETLLRCCRGSRPYLGNRTVDAYIYVVKQALGLLVSVSSEHYCPSTSDLSPGGLPGALPGYPVGALILKHASRLDAFSGYHFPT